MGKFVAHLHILQCPHWDSNPDCADFKSAASANWAMGATPDVRDRPRLSLGRGQQGGRSGRKGQGRPRIAESNAGCFYNLVDRPRSATQTARVAVTVR